MRLNPKQIALYTGGRFLIEPIDSSEILTGITWDSRNVEAGSLYIALPGERVDGHAFVEAALKAGARAALVTEMPSKSACIYAAELGAAIIEVPNTMHAVEDLARHWRDYIKGCVIAVTGSVGKTSTKNLIRDVCAARFSTVATVANQNNELGVPNTILSADPSTEVVVVEMGMRGLGQIRQLCEIARPDWGVITNVGESHMELLGTRENIARAKDELFEVLPSGTGWAFANAADDQTPFLIKNAKLYDHAVRIAFYGEGPQDDPDEFIIQPPEGSGQAFARLWPENVQLDGEGLASFDICARGFTPKENKQATLFDMEPDMVSGHCHLSIRGIHNVANACAAASVGLALGMDIQTVCKALSASLPEAGRMETVRARDGFLVINDAYNANPDSMRAAISMISSMDVKGNRIAVLGDMGELGDAEVECHRGIGRDCAASNLNRLIAVGELAQHIADAAIEAGMPEGDITRAATVGEALAALEGELSADDVVVVKASHFMRLDRVVEGLVS